MIFLLLSVDLIDDASILFTYQRMHGSYRRDIGRMFFKGMLLLSASKEVCFSMVILQLFPFNSLCLGAVDAGC